MLSFEFPLQYARVQIAKGELETDSLKTPPSPAWKWMRETRHLSSGTSCLASLKQVLWWYLCSCKFESIGPR